jgi:predicted RNA-binding protein Jag
MEAKKLTKAEVNDAKEWLADAADFILQRPEDSPVIRVEHASKDDGTRDLFTLLANNNDEASLLIGARGRVVNALEELLRVTFHGRRIALEVGGEGRRQRTQRAPASRDASAA